MIYLENTVQLGKSECKLNEPTGCFSVSKLLKTEMFDLFIAVEIHLRREAQLLSYMKIFLMLRTPVTISLVLMFVTDIWFVFTISQQRHSKS